MKLPLSWIKEWIEIDLEPKVLAERLTAAGIEVDSLDPAPLPFSGVVVGEVLEAQPHPEADRLTVATVSDGAETFQVVCGAPNCRKGLKTPFAKVGARVLDREGKEAKIKKGKLRGVESQGMLCALDELGLGQSEGIAELPANSPVGIDLSHLYGDQILEVSLTPNLGHCASVRGLARELSALTERPYKGPSIAPQKGKGSPVRVETLEGCPRYTCRAIRGVKVGPSPDWLRIRLERSGIRSVSNVVDVTNYVMLELGQPLHAFDLAKLQGGIVVRPGREGESLTTLDGVKRPLSHDILTISDDRGPVAIAGVMGGEESEVTDATVDLLLESALFEPAFVRRSARQLGIGTESHRRFERGVDPMGVLEALDRATALIVEMAGGVAEAAADTHPKPFPKRKIALRTERVNALLGTTLSEKEIGQLLARLEFEGKGQIAVPTYRTDVTAEIDLIEEVARLYGYDNIPRAAPRYTESTLPDDPAYCFERRIRTLLIGQGLQELLTSSLVSKASAPHGTPLLNHPLVLRDTLLPSLLEALHHNQTHRLFDIAAFEVGRIYPNGEEKGAIGVLLAGNTPHHPEEKSRPFDFYDLKGACENLLAALSISDVTFHKSKEPLFHPNRQAHLLQGNALLGTLGEVHPSRLREAGVEGRVLFAQFDRAALQSGVPERVIASPLPTQPSSERDWTATLPEETQVGEWLERIKRVPSRLLKDVKLLDIYRSERVGVGKKNVTVRMVYRDDKKTVSADQVEADHARIIKEVEG
ncbi:MAG: phenylalanine--tRNA ligase subunit beta [Parachlamydiales bacterium]